MEDDRTTEMQMSDLLYYAWGIIANAGGGDWTTQTDDWQKAAASFREQWHELIAQLRTLDSELDNAERS